MKKSNGATPFEPIKLEPAYRKVASALLDRITDRAHIVQTGTESFRFRRTLGGRKRQEA